MNNHKERDRCEWCSGLFEIKGPDDVLCTCEIKEAVIEKLDGLNYIQLLTVFAYINTLISKSKKGED